MFRSIMKVLNFSKKIKNEVCFLTPNLGRQMYTHNIKSVTTLSEYKQIQNNKLQKLAKILSKYLDKDLSTSEAVVASNSHLINYKVTDIEQNLQTCSRFNFDKKLIEDNLWLVQIRPDYLKWKIDLVSKLNLKDVNHGIPFISLPFKSLLSLYYRIINDIKSSNINRLYYLSEKLNIDPVVLANQLSSRLFIYNIPFNRLETTLKCLLDYGTLPENIVRDLWVLRCSPEKTKDRMMKFSVSGKSKMMPWMVKCSDSVVKKSIDLTITTKEVLGENTDSMNYLAERLHCSYQVVSEMCKRTPSIQNTRVSKLKNILDLFFSLGYKEIDLILTCRVFAHSVKTLEKRYYILQSYGVKHAHLGFLCLSARDFQKFLARTKNKIKAEMNNNQ